MFPHTVRSRWGNKGVFVPVFGKLAWLGEEAKGGRRHRPALGSGVRRTGPTVPSHQFLQGGTGCMRKEARGKKGRLLSLHQKRWQNLFLDPVALGVDVGYW